MIRLSTIVNHNPRRLAMTEGHRSPLRFLRDGSTTAATLDNVKSISQQSSLSSYRWMSSISSLPPPPPSSPPATVAAAAGATKPAPSSSNIILDHLGTIFLSAIGLIVASLVRSSYGTSNKNKVRDSIETHSALDPVEMEQLRHANAHRITPAVFRQLHENVVQKILSQETSHGLETSLTTTTTDDGYETTTDGTHQTANEELSCTYLEFANAVKLAMVELPPEVMASIDEHEHGGSNSMLPTIDLGHLLDRVVVAALDQEIKRQQSAPASITEPATLDTDLRRPLTFWFTALSLAMESDVSERIRILYEVLSYHPSRSQYPADAPAMQPEDHNNATTASTPSSPHSDNHENNNNMTTSSRQRHVTWTQVCDMVGYLQETCQLAPDTQVLATPDRQYPIQQYHRGKPLELTPVVQDPIDLPAFAEILRSRSVCAWGECYHKAKQSI